MECQFDKVCYETPLYLLTYLLTHSLTHSLTSGSKVLLEKLTGSQLVKKFASFYGTPRFITAFTRSRHLSRASSIQSIPPHPTSWRSILILSSHLRLGLQKWSLSLRFPHQNPVYTASLSHTCYMPHPSHCSRFDHPNNIGWRVQIIKAPRYVVLSIPLLHRPS